jgi:tetratricopeptide (TPR) repeat protein
MKPLACFSLVMALLFIPPAASARPMWLDHAQALEKNGDWQGLLAWGEQWTHEEADNALAWFVLGRALSQLKHYPEAIRAYRQDLRLDPNDRYAHNNLGNAYRATGRYREAMDAYHAAVRSSPDYITAWQNLGLAFYELKGPLGVAQALQRLQATDPGLAEAWRRLAVEYSLTQDAAVTQSAIRILRGLSATERERMFDILLGQS